MNNPLLRLFKAVAQHPWVLAGSLVASLATAALAGLFPFIEKLAVDQAFKPVGSFAALAAPERYRLLIILVVAMVAFKVLEFVTRMAQVRWISQIGNRYVTEMLDQLYQKLHRLPISFFDKNSTGRLMTCFSSDLQNIQSFVEQSLGVVISSLLQLIVVALGMLILDFRLGLIAMFSMVGLYFAIKFIRLRVNQASVELRSAQVGLNSVINEQLMGFEIIRLFKIGIWSQKLVDKASESLKKAGKIMMRWVSLLPLTSYFTNQGAIAAIVLAGIILIANGNITLGTIVAFLGYFRLFFIPLENLAFVSNTYEAALVSINKVYDLLDTANMPDGNHRFNPDEPNSIELQSLWFSYQENPQSDGDFVLKDINLKIKPGQKLAFVGASGVGKSSLVNLLNGFYPYQKGQILIDGIKIQNYHSFNLRKYLTIIQQDVFFFADTIENNLSGYNQDTSLAEIEKICGLLGIASFIQALTDGYQTKLGPGGAQISSGQRQFLAFARALIRNPYGILVLDEATASLDYESERVIQAALAVLLINRTALVIAHRLSTAQQCDEIIVLNQGRIIGQGKHKELMHNCQYYAELYQLQSIGNKMG